VLIDGAVEVPLDGAMEEEDLVDVPAAAKPTTMPPGYGRELWTEGLGPGEHGPGRDIDATRTQELSDLPGGERVAQVPTDRGEDDLRRPPVAREGAVGSVGEVSMTRMAGEVLTAAAVETIARSGGLVAGRAGGHRPTLPRAPHDFADSGTELESNVRELARSIARIPASTLRMKKLAINRVAEVAGFRTIVPMGAETDALLHYSADVKALAELINAHGLKEAIARFDRRESAPTG
jgi:hypothetical protein